MPRRSAPRPALFGGAGCRAAASHARQRPGLLAAMIGDLGELPGDFCLAPPLWRALVTTSGPIPSHVRFHDKTIARLRDLPR